MRHGNKFHLLKKMGLIGFALGLVLFFFAICVMRFADLQPAMRYHIDTQAWNDYMEQFAASDESEVE